MELTYLGKKDAVTIGEPFLSKEYVFHKKSDPVSVLDPDAKKLMETNPRMFSGSRLQNHEVNQPIQFVSAPLTNEADDAKAYTKTALTRMKKEEIIEALAGLELIYSEGEFTKTELMQLYLDATKPEEAPEPVKSELEVPKEDEKSDFE